MKAIVVLAAVVALTGAAARSEPAASSAGDHAMKSSATAPASSCFRSQDMQSHTFAGDHTMYVRVRMHDVYQVEVSGRCLAGHSSFDPIVIDPSPPSGLVCKPIDLNLKIGHQGAAIMPTPCIVDSLRKLTPAEVAALPAKLRP